MFEKMLCVFDMVGDCPTSGLMMGQYPPHCTYWGTHILHVGKSGPPNPLVVSIFPPFSTSVCQTHAGVICGKHALVSVTFYHRPKKAMSVWTWKKLV